MQPLCEILITKPNLRSYHGVETEMQRLGDGEFEFKQQRSSCGINYTVVEVWFNFASCVRIVSFVRVLTLLPFVSPGS